MILLTDLTPWQRAGICNGCGARSGWFAWLKPPTGHALDSCDAHDLAYWIGGRWHSPARWVADWQLLTSLLRQARTRPRWQRPGFTGKAVLYWIGVRLGGWASFHHGAPRTLEDIARHFPAPRLRLVERGDGEPRSA